MVSHLEKLFLTWGHDDQELVNGVERLVSQWGDRIYQDALRILVGKHFALETSRRYWKECLEHRNDLFADKHLKRALRPALLDYLHRVVKEIHDPRIVEANLLKNIERASVSDGLTGLFNQTFFKEHLGKIINRRRSSGNTFAVLLLDLDHFKQYNDRCGHLCGDEALRQVGAIIGDCIREGDIAARYGGEEFAVFLSRVNRQQAFTIAERIRRTVEKTVFPKQELLDRKNLTVSGGIAVYPEDGETPESVIDHADRELYHAKKYRNAIAPAGKERRRSARQALRSLIEFAEPGQDDFKPALSVDISPGGISIDCDTRFKPGVPLQIRFRQPFWPTSERFETIVRFIGEIPGSTMARIGLEFTADSELVKKLLPFAADRQAWPRPAAIPA